METWAESIQDHPGLQGLQELRLALGEDNLVLVGGCLRDLLLDRPIQDLDLATPLLPEVVLSGARAAGLKAFPTGIQHGTVTVISQSRPVEITTFRGDGPYTDGRRPDLVHLGVDLLEDLARRDFTINAMALPLKGVSGPDWVSQIVDPFGGQEDLRKGLIRTVGDPIRRFSEDGLRPLRACRFISQLGFHMESATDQAIPRCWEVSQRVAVERVFVELNKLLLGAFPHRGLNALQGSGLLDLWLQELRPMVGCPQNTHHRHDVWTHTIEVVRCVDSPDLHERLILRWAALLHDSGKPATRTLDAKGQAHFYQHEQSSLRTAESILERLRAPKAWILEIGALIRRHGIHPQADWSGAAWRRLLRKLDTDGLPLERWGRFRLADIQARGFQEEENRVEHERMMQQLESMALENPPLSVRELALDGHQLMKLVGRRGGPWLGKLQEHLLNGVLEDPELNHPESLERRVLEWIEAEQRL